MSTFTQDWFSQHIPIWEAVLLPLKGTPLNALEIGSFEGRSTVWLCEQILTNPESHITCIDPYEKYSDLNQFSFDWETIKQRFLDNTAPFKEKITWIKEKSEQILHTLPRLSFDFIYVDGGHTSEQCLLDGVLSHLLLKPGGIIIFDDYLWGSLIKAPNLPKSAIDAFMECFAEQYELIQSGYQIILRKK